VTVILSKLPWQENEEYRSYVDDLLATPQVQKLAEYTQHHYTDRLQHSITVSYDSYLLGKKLHLNCRALARAGLLHDMFYYDWRNTKFDLGTHAYIHPRIAVHNAEKITPLSDMERDIILKHMFGATAALPRYKESWVVSLVDDYAAVKEFSKPTARRQWRELKKRLISTF
jgi:uncharacterized protein